MKIKLIFQHTPVILYWEYCYSFLLWIYNKVNVCQNNSLGSYYKKTGKSTPQEVRIQLLVAITRW